jgi:hypothetical protein
MAYTFVAVFLENLYVIFLSARVSGQLYLTEATLAASAVTRLLSKRDDLKTETADVSLGIAKARL